MTVRRITNDFMFANGTQYQGSIRTHYDDLVLAFGEPGLGFDEGKSEFEWILATPAGAATVYDYHGNRWHVGGYRPEVVAHVEAAIAEAVAKRNAAAAAVRSGS